MPAADEVTPSDILSRIENSPHAELLHDEVALERTLIELMGSSRHPVLAEMGRELQQGNVSWQGLAGIPGYQAVLADGFVAMQRIDLADVAAGLDADVAVPIAEDDPAPEDEEPDELFRGLEHERR
jgi:hypothetical protein